MAPSPLPPGPPPRPPPPGDPSLLPHNSAGAQVNSVTWALFGVATCFLAVRLYCKRISRHGFWWDDVILTASWVVLLVAGALLSKMIAMGFGRHPWDQYWGSPGEKIIMWVRNTLVMVAQCWSKTAFAVTLLKFAEGWVKGAVWFILVSLNVIVTLNCIINWVGCTPIEKSWKPEVEGHCVDILKQIIIIGDIGGYYGSACDFCLALLPWTIIWKLNIQRKEKLGVGIAMSCGIAAGIMAAIKTAHLKNLSTGDSYDAAILNIWDSTEVSVTIIAASIPTLRVLFRDLVLSGQSTETENSTTGKGGQNLSDIVRPRKRININNPSEESILNLAQGRIHAHGAPPRTAEDVELDDVIARPDTAYTRKTWTTVGEHEIEVDMKTGGENKTKTKTKTSFDEIPS